MLDGEEILFDENCFTQSNLSVNELIWEKIKGQIESLPQHNQALDLYCGVGNFSFPMARKFKQVIGVESEGVSIEWAKRNSKEKTVKDNRPDNIEFREGLVEDKLDDLIAAKTYFDFVLLYVQHSLIFLNLQ